MVYPIILCFVEFFMKKAIFLGITVLLALAIFACPAFVAEPDNESGIRIGTSSSRALSDLLARAGIDYFEVAFHDGTEVYRTTWNKGQSGRIQLPPGSYGLNARNAILFAGSYRDKTLLAVGLLTSIDNVDCVLGDAPTLRIEETTRTIEFTLLPLLTDVKADPDSTFQIIDADDTPGYKNTADYTAADFPKLRAGVEQPTALFMIPKDREQRNYAPEIPGTPGEITLTLTNPSSSGVDPASITSGTTLSFIDSGFTYSVTLSTTIALIADATSAPIIFTATLPGENKTPPAPGSFGTSIDNVEPYFEVEITDVEPGTDTIPEVTASTPVAASFQIGLPQYTPNGGSSYLNFASDFGTGIWLVDEVKFYKNAIFNGPYANLVDITATSPSKLGGDDTLADLDIAVHPVDTTASLIEFDITTKNEDYCVKLYLEIPVNPISDEATGKNISPNTWFIRGGMNNILPDEGSDVNSVGGAILLGIGTLPSHYIIIGTP